MLSLTRKPSQDDKTVSYKGYQIEANISFNAIIRCTEILQHDLFNEVEKVVLMFRNVVKNWEQYETFNAFDRDKVVQMIFDKFMEYKKEGESEPVLDYVIDADKIYTSFLMININLHEQLDVMEWPEFIAIFNNLPDDSPIMKAIGYRSMTIPTEKEVGRKERQRLIKLKEYYELPHQRKKREEQMIEAVMKIGRQGRG